MITRYKYILKHIIYLTHKPGTTGYCANSWCDVENAKSPRQCVKAHSVSIFVESAAVEVGVNHCKLPSVWNYHTLWGMFNHDWTVPALLAGEGITILQILYIMLILSCR